MGKTGKTEKITITLPRDLAGEIRSIVSQGEVSSFCATALKHYLVYRKQKTALGKGFGAWKNEDHPELATPQDSTSRVNNIRSFDKTRLERLGGNVAE
jgi:hypothetical protein